MSTFRTTELTIGLPTRAARAEGGDWAGDTECTLVTNAPFTAVRPVSEPCKPEISCLKFDDVREELRLRLNARHPIPLATP